MHLNNEDLRRVAEIVWTTTLGLELSLVEPDAPKSEQHDFLTGCVHIVGAWEGAMALCCSAGLARQAASIMFGCDEPQPEEIRDARGELANMTGGNIKSLLPGPSRLSLPCIVEGKNHHLTIGGSELLNRLFFECQGEPLEVLLMKRNSDSRHAPITGLDKSA